MFAFTQSNTFEYSSSKVLLYENGKNAIKTCNICFKTMRGDHLKRHMLKHENRKKGENVEEKELEVLRVVQNYEMIRKNMKKDIAESKRKIELGRIMADIAEKRDMNISLLPKEKQEAIEFFEKFGNKLSCLGIACICRLMLIS